MYSSSGSSDESMFLRLIQHASKHRSRSRLYNRPASTIRCRNCCVRSSRGALKICCGGPSSRIDARVQEADPVRDVAREAHLVRRDHHRHPAGGELADHVEHLGHELGVEGARHLVEQQQLGLHRERAHDRDALLLPAGEPVGVLVSLVGEAEALRAARSPGRRPRARGCPSALRGASVTFSSTVMCGKRLNDWKTIPIRRRIALTSTLRAVISSPPTTIRPASIGSSRLTQRSSVDLPEPDAPIRQTTSCSATSRSIPRSTSSLPNDLCRPSMRSAGAAVRLPAHASLPACCCFAVARDQPVGEARERDRDRDEQRRRDEIRRAVERRRLVDLRLLERLDDAERADERRVLLQADEVVEERRDHAPHRLGEDDEAQRLAAREAERACGGLLARVHRVDARRGRPRRRTRCRRARARRRPRRTATSGTHESPSAGIPKPSMR